MQGISQNEWYNEHLSPSSFELSNVCGIELQYLREVEKYGSAKHGIYREYFWIYLVNFFTWVSSILMILFTYNSRQNKKWFLNKGGPSIV